MKDRALTGKDGEKLLELMHESVERRLRPIVAQQSALKTIAQLLLADASPELHRALLHSLAKTDEAIGGVSEESKAAWTTVANEWRDTIARISNVPR